MTQKLLSAIYFATCQHQTQLRKTNDFAYIEHPLSVALLTTRITDNQDVHVAAILHDTVEDTKTNLHEIRELFGQNVANLVAECTEDKRFSWKKRKQQTKTAIPHMTREAAIIKSADLLHNYFELLQKLNETGPSIMTVFGAPPKEKMDDARDRLTLLQRHHPNPLLDDLEQVLDQIGKLLRE